VSKENAKKKRSGVSSQEGRLRALDVAKEEAEGLDPLKRIDQGDQQKSTQGDVRGGRGGQKTGTLPRVKWTWGGVNSGSKSCAGDSGGGGKNSGLLMKQHPCVKKSSMPGDECGCTKRAPAMLKVREKPY